MAEKIKIYADLQRKSGACIVLTPFIYKKAKHKIS